MDYQRNNPGTRVVINYSAGGSPSTTKENAVIYANTYGVPIVAGAGNGSGSPVYYPAAYSSTYSNVIAVSATDHNDQIASYSNAGPQVNVAAPGGWGSYYDGSYRYNGPLNQGQNIFSTTPNYPFLYQTYYGIDVDTTYGYLGGTSMATPHVNGVAALILSLNPNLTAADVRTIIEQTADDKGTPGRDDYYGYGRVNCYRALRYTLEHYGGTLSGNVVLREHLTIPSSVTLNISPGTNLQLQNDAALTIYGTLNAQGTASQRIVIDGQNLSGWTTPMIFVLQAGGASIAYADLKNAKYQLVARTSGSISVDNCSFTNFGGSGNVAVEVDQNEGVPNGMGNAAITNNAITGTAKSGYGIYLWNVVPASLNVTGNSIQDCYAAIESHV